MLSRTKWRGHKARLALAGLVCLAAVGLLTGCEVWVDDDFGPGNAGGHTWGVDAFATVQEGIDAMVPSGGILHVAAGTYPENVGFSMPVEVDGDGSAVIAPASGTAMSITGHGLAGTSLNGITLGGPDLGLQLQHVDFIDIGIGNTTFADTLSEYIRLEQSAGDVDATGATFLGAAGGADIEAKVWHKIDDPNLGLVSYPEERAPAILTAYDVAGKRGKTVQLMAKLMGSTMPGRTLSFWVDGSQFGTAVTDAVGVAKLSFPIAADARLGDHPVAVVFGGEATHAPAVDEAVLSVSPQRVKSLTLSLHWSPVLAGQQVRARVMGDNGVDYTQRATYAIESGAGGSWAGNRYTSEVAGTWKVTATYGTLSCSEQLVVNHGLARSLTIAPAQATITTAQTQAYTVQAADAQGNAWVPAPWQIWWLENGGGGFFGNTYTPAPADAGTTVNVRARLGTLISNLATLKVRAAAGPGMILAWDKDTYNFYLCANPANPQTGTLVPATNGTHTVDGVSLTVSGAGGNRTVQVGNSAAIANSLRVRWYVRSGAVYNAYLYSTIGGTQHTAVYRSDTSGGLTCVDGVYKSGFWGETHELDAPDPTTITSAAELQP